MTRRPHSPVALLLAVLAATPAPSQQQPLAIPPADLGAFVDGMFDIQLKRDDAAGAVLLLGHNGAPLLSRGYGMADVRKAIPMTPETVVRGGALTTAIIAVAVMQQVESDKLSLDSDIAGSIDIPLPARPDGPITLRHLLTHTAGFVGAPSTSPSADLRAFLLTDPPRRAFPAGAIHSFSAYGMALAAYAVQCVTRQAFNDYVQQSIFGPLDMSRSSLLDPLPPELAAQASQGYGASMQPPLAHEPLAPSMTFSTTASDMGRFGAMLLAGGTLHGRHVLTPQSVATILSRQASPLSGLTPEIPTMALGFHQVWFNGAHLFGVSGDTAAFHCEFEVDPDRGLLIFLAYNSSGHPGPPGSPSKLAVFARGELIHGIFDRYQPFHPTVVSTTPTAAQESLASGTWIPASEFDLPSAQRHPVHTLVDPATRALMADRFVSDRDTVKRWPMLLANLWQQYPQDRILAISGASELPDRLVLAADPANDLIRLP